MTLLFALQLLLGAGALYFVGTWIFDLIKNKSDLGKDNPVLGLGIGFVTDFFDTLGIGSFAPTTMLFQVTKFLKAGDKQLPGTLNVSHTIPVLMEAFLFLAAVEVGGVTLFSMVISSIIGAIVGAKFINGFSEKKIQTIMGVCLLVTVAIMAAKQLGWIDLLGAGNTANSLTGIPLVIGVVGNFIFGALMMAGVGLYAPCMAMVYMLGLSPLVAFPIMMASCAGLMAIGSPSFIREGNYSRKGSLSITIGGVIGVFVAYKFVTGLDLNILTWVIICVVVFTAITMLKKGLKKA